MIIGIHKDCIQTIFPATGEERVIFGIQILRIDILFRSRTDESDIGAIIMIELRTNNPQVVINIIERLSGHPCVVFAEPDFIWNLISVLTTDIIIIYGAYKKSIVP